ncbi:MAG: hypothetical protein CM1200mP41_33430 [Gammaproteobacteria bacterium]|nr:MAG: hypothetical protein CM1200mP41_33430 [Gammaproteobacteria bacterium]
MTASKTLFQKIFDRHVVLERDSGDALLYIDRHLIHDLHHRAFATLKANGQTIHRPELLFGTPDHSVPTTARTLVDIPQGEMRETVSGLEAAAKEMGFNHFDLTDDRHGIVHVVGPEQGITLPGLVWCAVTPIHRLMEPLGASHSGSGRQKYNTSWQNPKNCGNGDHKICVST